MQCFLLPLKNKLCVLLSAVKKNLKCHYFVFIQINLRLVWMVYIQWMNFKVRTSRRNDDFTIHGNFGFMLFCMSFSQIIEILFTPQFRFLLSKAIRWVTYENGHNECYVIAPHPRKDARSLYSFFPRYLSHPLRPPLKV